MNCRVARLKSCGGLLYTLLCGLALLVLSSCGHRSLADEIKIDLDNVTEVRIQTAQQLSQALSPGGSLEWHQISDSKELASFIQWLGEAKRIGEANAPFPKGDGVITLVLESRGLYGLKYFIKDGRLLDIHTGVWYLLPRELDKVLNGLEAIPIVKKWD